MIRIMTHLEFRNGQYLQTWVQGPERPILRNAQTAATLCLSAALLVIGINSADATHAAEHIPESRILADITVSLAVSPDILKSLPLLNQDLLQRVTIHEITYDSVGIPVSGYLFKPSFPGPHPAVIYNRGGYGQFGMLTPDLTFLQLADIAAEGYVIAASQYRGTMGAPGHDGFGGEDVEDVLSLIGVLEELEEVDAARIGMIGHSRGGMMTYLALTRTNRISAAVVLAGPADLVSGLKDRPEMMQVYSQAIGPEGADLTAALKARSAIGLVEQFPLTSPILIVHGTADWRVSPTDSLRMAERLLARHVPFRLELLEGGDHGLSEYELEVQTMIRDWLKRYLSANATLPNVMPHGP
jgi:dipeptidyl aminopeptidase/acylaminoacyl peptidase